MGRKSKSKGKIVAAPSTTLTIPNSKPNDASPLPKDREEEELEKLVFGDVAGFHEGLRLHEEEELPEAGAEQDDPAVHGQVDAAKTQELTALNDDQLFFVDEGENGALATRDSDDDVEMTVAIVNDEADPPAWEDSDDEKMMISLASHTQMRKLRDVVADDYVSGTEYARRLRRQFERIYPVPAWALPERATKRRRLSQASASSDDEGDLSDEGEVAQPLSAVPLAALLSSSAGLTLSKTSQKTQLLRPEVIDIARLTDANVSAPSKSPIQCLSFHPTHPLLLTSGLDATLRLYHIDGKTNPLATSLHINGSALHTSLIHPSGNQIIAAGRRRYFHIWDLESGAVQRVNRVYGHEEVQKSMERFDISPNGKHISLIGSKGTVQILDAMTNQWIATARVEGVVADVSWHPDGQTLSIANKVGEIYEYFLPTKSFSSVWRDEGGVNLTRIANSPAAGARFVAVGSASGIVNIYDRRISFGGKVPGSMGSPTDPKPVKTVESIVTGVSTLEFSTDGQLLAIASKGKKDALRLVHLPSCAIYKNWPTSATPLGKVTAVKFSGAGGKTVLAVGNEAGKVRLFEVRA